ncbi:carnitine O-acetyltransferase-like [Drosophila innubila]|uniref:carnitine O-acetyltransferase-like n=1 Tax=Drosophila innubila TaxID=198719 RepID=UPI00148D445C|nr:carnitine O-acetyltransferase-like [Drosophila innubila]
MRAVFVGESIISKCPSIVRNYSQSKSNETSNNQKAVTKVPPVGKNRLIKWVFNYFKTWGEQFEPMPSPTPAATPAAPAAAPAPLAPPRRTEAEGKCCELQQKQLVPKITIRNHSTNPTSCSTHPLHIADAVCPIQKLETTPNSLEVQSQNSLLAVKIEPEAETLPLQQVPMNLLTYPVVPLEETLHRYLNSIRPFFKDEAFLKQQEQTIDFLNNMGGELQKLLEKAGKKDANWLSDRWITAKYLRHRGPLTVFSSPCIAFPKQDFRNVIDFVHFTAQVIYGMCEFKNLLDNDRIPVYRMGKFDLDNSQYHQVFGTVRKPKRSCDILEQCNSDYVIIIHNNNFHKLPVYNAEGRILNINQLRNELLKIVQSCQSKGPEIGLLTHDTRDSWADAYEILCRGENNINVMQCIEQSLFTVSLDESVMVHQKGQERSVLAGQLLHGGGFNVNSSNRWMDKTLQLIVNPNGMAGFCLEHAPADPQPAATIMDFVQTNIINPEYGNDSCPVEIFDKPHPLYFTELDETLDLWLGAARRNISKICSRIRLEVFKFPCYGKCLIKSQGLSPDSFIQMALQLAFYRLHKELPAQYESAHLRIFKSGRTETIRSSSNESLDFVCTMTSVNASLRERILALQSAVDWHQEQTKLAMQGQAVDRHLFGLKQMAREHAIPLPEFFCSQGYVKSTNFQVLSSQVATPHDGFMSFGPLSSDGYGCCYNPRENDIIFAISSWKLKPKICATRYGKAIELALADMGQLLLEAGGRSVAQNAFACKEGKK